MYQIIKYLLFSILLTGFLSDCKKNITEEPVVPSVEIISEDIAIPEGNEQYFIQAGITVEGNRFDTVSMEYITRDVTAMAEEDYVPIWGSLSFPPADTSSTQILDIKIYGNKITEEDESFEVYLYNIKNAEITEHLINITLLNDDEPHDTFPGYITPLEYEGMTLVWHDEFDLDFYSSNWTHAIGDGCPNLCGWGNNQLQYYRPENTVVENGLLTITAKEEPYSGKDYTASRILSQDKFEFRYGRVDIRARLPKGKGIWPALWMLGANRNEIGWPECGEIDIMELRGSTPWKICGTLHYQNANGNNANSGAECFILPGGETYDEQFHVFSIAWNEDRIVWYLDDQQFNQEYFTNMTFGPYGNPFHKAFYFLLNVAVGGNYDGDPDASTEFPQKMEVDYIRVFQAD